MSVLPLLVLGVAVVGLVVFGVVQLHVPYWPLVAGLVLALLAAVFRSGQQLRKDAAGLV